jgi:ankyrin repeat protein
MELLLTPYAPKTDNETPLHLASGFVNFETVELLIEKGASVNGP